MSKQQKKHLCLDCDNLFPREAERGGGTFFIITCRLDGREMATGSTKETVKYKHSFTRCLHYTGMIEPVGIEHAAQKIFTRQEEERPDMMEPETGRLSFDGGEIEEIG